MAGGFHGFRTGAHADPSHFSTGNVQVRQYGRRLRFGIDSVRQFSSDLNGQLRVVATESRAALTIPGLNPDEHVGLGDGHQQHASFVDADSRRPVGVGRVKVHGRAA